MTITSTGYAGTVNDEQWAELAPRLGAFYSVGSFGAFRVTAASGTRTVQVAASLDGAVGRGIRDVNDAPVNVTLTASPSGSRWDLIVLRRNWATKASTIAVVTGGSAMALPPRNANPGTLDDQPLALVRVAAGQSTIQEIIDLRTWAQNGGAVGAHDLVRSYMDHPGTQIRIGDATWTRIINSAGSATWVSDESIARAWLTKHVTENRTVGRAYFGTGDQATDGAGSYLGMSPVGGLDEANKDAFWFITKDGTLLRISKNGDISVTGRINAPHAPWAEAAGVRTGVNASYDQVIKFPAGRFTVPPIVVAQLVSTAGADIGKGIMIGNITKDQFILRHDGTSGTVTAHWHATQMSAASAAG